MLAAPPLAVSFVVLDVSVVVVVSLSPLCGILCLSDCCYCPLYVCMITTLYVCVYVVVSYICHIVDYMSVLVVVLWSSLLMLYD